MSRELGHLSRWLRLLGYDTLYAQPQESKASLLIQSLREERVLLARDRRLIGHRGVRTLWIQSDQVKEQLKQVLKETGAKPKQEELFTRCLRCNELLKEIPKEKAKERVPPYVYKTVADFVLCPRCDQIFWPGTHLSLAEDFLKTVRERR